MGWDKFVFVMQYLLPGFLLLACCGLLKFVVHWDDKSRDWLRRWRQRHEQRTPETLERAAPFRFVRLASPVQTLSVVVVDAVQPGQASDLEHQREDRQGAVEAVLVGQNEASTPPQTLVTELHRVVHARSHQ